jgi:hypothetical protein
MHLVVRIDLANLSTYMMQLEQKRQRQPQQMTPLHLLQMR